MAQTWAAVPRSDPAMELQYYYGENSAVTAGPGDRTVPRRKITPAKGRPGPGLGGVTGGLALFLAIPALIIGSIALAREGPRGPAGPRGVMGPSGPAGADAAESNVTKSYAAYMELDQEILPGASSPPTAVTRYLPLSHTGNTENVDPHLQFSTDANGHLGILCNDSSLCGTYLIIARVSLQAPNITVGQSASCDFRIIQGNPSGFGSFTLQSAAVAVVNATSVVPVEISTTARLSAIAMVFLGIETKGSAGWQTVPGIEGNSHSITFLRIDV